MAYRAPSPSPYGAPSPYRAPSPYGAPSPYATADSQYHPQPFAAAPGGQIVPGAITYTTSTGPDGRVIYHPFKAVSASYSTANGIVSGIQWVPAEATQILPPGAQPATSEFAASWNRGNPSREEQKSLKDWQRDEEKRRKKEEKESTKRRGQERPGHGRNDSDYELRKARERDTQVGIERERRKSFNAGVPAYPLAPGGTGYPPSPYSNLIEPPSGSNVGGAPYGTATSAYTRSASGNYPDLSRQFNDLDIDRNRDQPGEKASGLGRPRKYSIHETAQDRPRPISGNYGAPYGAPGPYGAASSTYAPAAGPYSNPRPYPTAPGGQHQYTSSGSYSNNPSPNMRPSEVPYAQTTHSGYPGSTFASPPRGPDPMAPIARSTTPFGGPPPQVYPRGHVMEGQPIHQPSRATTPIPGVIPASGAGAPYANPPSTYPGQRSSSPLPPGAALLPNEQQQQLPAPEAFSRPINAALPYTPFETMKIQDMDEFFDHIPRMPLALKPHDVNNQDWFRMMEDLSLSWAGNLPVQSLGRDGRPPKPSTLAAELIDLWNASFFFARGIEVVLYKGRERRSGTQIGKVDLNMPYDDDSDSPSSSEEEDTDDSDYGNTPAGPYGRPTSGQPSLSEIAAGRRRRHETKQEKRQRRKEKKQRRKAKANEKKYALYITCLPMSGGATGMPGGYPGVHSMGNYNQGRGGGY